MQNVLSFRACSNAQAYELVYIKKENRRAFNSIFSSQPHRWRQQADKLAATLHLRRRWLSPSPSRTYDASLHRGNGGRLLSTADTPPRGESVPRAEGGYRRMVSINILLFYVNKLRRRALTSSIHSVWLAYKFVKWMFYQLAAECTDGWAAVSGSTVLDVLIGSILVWGANSLFQTLEISSDSSSYYEWALENIAIWFNMLFKILFCTVKHESHSNIESDS